MFFGLFNGLQAKIIALVVGLALIVSVYFYIQHLRSSLAFSKLELQKMESVITQQKLVLERNDQDIRKMQKLNSELNDQFQESQSQVDQLNSQLEKLNEAAPTQQVPELEESINRLSRDSFRCNEIVSGSVVRKEDRNNTVCGDMIAKELKRNAR